MDLKNSSTSSLKIIVPSFSVDESLTDGIAKHLRSNSIDIAVTRLLVDDAGVDEIASIRPLADSADAWLFTVTEKILSTSGFKHLFEIVRTLPGVSGNKLMICIIGDFLYPEYFEKERLYVHLNVKDPASTLANNIKNYLIEPIMNKTGSIPGPDTKLLKVQEQLKDLNIYRGAINGYDSDEFNRAVKAFQKENKLFQDGIIGGQFLSALDKELNRRQQYLTSRPVKDEKPRQEKFWVLKINPQNWEIPEFEIRDLVYFSSHLTANRKRPEYNLFEKVGAGDLVAAYAGRPYESIVAIFSVKNRLARNEINGESIEMEIAQIIDPPIPIEIIREGISFAEALQGEEPVRLYQINRQQFKKITDIDAAALPVYLGSTKNEAPFNTDISDSTTADKLDFTNDIDSFAGIIGLRSITPPLSIGLFGNWGSGKSFFMEKLARAIDDLPAEKDQRFLKNVVHVRFNSWHYSDADLWASLFTQIFESLNEYAARKKFGKALVEEIYSKLEITKVQLEQTQAQIALVDLKVMAIQGDIDQLDNRIAEKKDRLDMLKAKQYYKILKEEPTIVNQLQNLPELLQGQELLDNAETLQGRIEEVQGFTNQLREALKLLSKMRKGGWLWVWIPLGIACLIFAALNFVPFTQAIRQWVKGLTISLTPLWIFSAFITRLRPHFKKVKQALSFLKRLKVRVDAEVATIKLNEEDSKAKLAGELVALKQQKSDKESYLQEKKSVKDELEQQLNDIGSGKVLTGFINEKSSDDSYRKSLGTISRVRKDFLQLSNLLEAQKASQEKELKEKGELFDKEGKVQIDRIVLYVDDLDRCSQDIVVQMLEAVHLLLAFNLFVVVVGVDPRWLNNALSRKYHDLFQNASGIAESGQASSYDYLEKIFQIPFALKAATTHGRAKLIDELTKLDLETVEASVKPLKTDAAQPRNEQQSRQRDNLAGHALAEVQSSQSPFAETISNRITLSAQEVQFIKIIAENLSTPRTIKRFVNIYRIIKAHKNYLHRPLTTIADHMPTIVLLAVIVGCPQGANDFVKQIKSSGNLRLPKIVKNAKNTELDKFFARLPAEELKMLTARDFQRNLELVVRFSFRIILSE